MVSSISISRDKTKLLAKIPQLPGVYIYKNNEKKPIYVGKAKNLRSRVRSYFDSDLLPKTASMMSEAKEIQIRTVGSELEALLLEAFLVRKLLPQFNVELRDDKSPIYIVITKDYFPKVCLARKSELGNIKGVTFGPYLSSRTAKSVLRQLRRLIPFSDHKIRSGACIYSQIGLCNPCPNIISVTPEPEKSILRKSYLANISLLKRTLKGDMNILTKSIEDKMANYSRNLEFEKAAEEMKKLKEIKGFETTAITPYEYIQNPNLAADIREEEMQEIISILSNWVLITKLERVECFDVAHLSGTFPVASMVTFIGGEPTKELYRHFIINSPKKRNDTAALKEVLERRLRHLTDWGTPDLIIVDGGKPQVGAANLVVHNIPVIGLAKRYETLIFKTGDRFLGKKLAPGPARNFFERIRDESHRFARVLHHARIAKTIRSI